jgi:hypothetical protein
MLGEDYKRRKKKMPQYPELHYEERKKYWDDLDAEARSRGAIVLDTPEEAHEFCELLRASGIATELQELEDNEYEEENDYEEKWDV